MTAYEVYAKYSYLVPITLRRNFRSIPPGWEEEDMLQEGSVGLWKAVSEFDSFRKVRFESYAISCIIYAIKEALRTKSDLRRSIQDLRRRYWASISVLTSQLGRKPTFEEMIREWKTDAASMEQIIQLVNNNEMVNLADLDDFRHISSHSDIHESLVAENEHTKILELLNHLPTTHRVVLLMTKVENQPHQTVARFLKLSFKEVAAYEEEAICIMRQIGGRFWNEQDQTFESGVEE